MIDPVTLRRTWLRLLGFAGVAFQLAGCETGTARPPSNAASVPATETAPAPHLVETAASSKPRNMLSRETALALEQADRDPYWLRAREEADTGVEKLLVQHEKELARGLRLSKVLRGNTGRKQLALTFDDGPHPAYTPKILDALREAKVPATFFLVGEMAERYPELVRAEQADGHSIGNHTYHHVSLPKIPEEYVATEIKACGEVLQKITGQAPHLFRPPGGQYNQEIAETSEALGYKLVLWTNDPGDYASPGESVIARRLLSRLDNGGIILIHDGISQTVELLPALIRQIRKEGYEFVTVDQLLQTSAKPTR